VSNNLTDGPTFKFVQTGHALCNLEIIKLGFNTHDVLVMALQPSSSSYQMLGR
jgi:hypothetical protein